MGAPEFSRRNVLKLGVSATALTALAPACQPATPARDTRCSGQACGWLPSGFGGGGFASVVAADPFHPGAVVDGQDIAGFWRSTDHARTWEPANGKAQPSSRLFTDTASLHVAAMRFSQTTPGKVYAATGQRAHSGVAGGFLVSTDGGRHWTLQSRKPAFTGGSITEQGGPPDGLTVPHPRSTGNLIELDETARLIYIATFVDGVMRSGDDGRTWETLDLDGSYLRSLALDDTDPRVLYACPFGRQVWKTTDAREGGRFERLRGSPTSVEELIVLDGVLYAAAGADGVVASNDGGRTWRQLYRPGGNARTRWLSITGRRGAGGPTLFAGALEPPTDPEHPDSVQSIVRSTDGGQSWRPITVASEVLPTVGGPGGALWWYRHASAWRFSRIGRHNFVPSYLEIDPFDERRLYVAGRAGIWRTDNAYAPAPTWYPCARRLNCTVNHVVTVDPNHPERVYVGDADWSFVYSYDRMRRVHTERPYRGKYANVTDIALDVSTTPSPVYVATDVDALGDVYSTPDPATAGFESEGLASCMRARYGRHHSALGLAVNRVGGKLVILAAVEGAGIWRKESGRWRQVVDPTRALGEQTTDRAILSWLPGSSTAFCYDRETGIWRSRDHGATWALIWRHPSGHNLGVSGFVLHPPSAPEVVYVSANDALYRVEGARGERPRPVPISTVANPGPLAHADGVLYVACYASAGSPRPRLYRGSVAEAETRWTDVADATYRQMSQFPRGLAVGPGGNVYVANRSVGVTVGHPREEARQPRAVRTTNGPLRNGE